MERKFKFRAWNNEKKYFIENNNWFSVSYDGKLLQMMMLLTTILMKI
jgi:hypothetical protein